MSYTRGTNTGRIRELVGDMDSLLFSDPQVEDALSQQGAVTRAAIYLLVRIHNDVDLLTRKYAKGGHLDQDMILRHQAQIMRGIELLERGPGTKVDTTPAWEPTANLSDRVAQHTDSDGMRKRTPIDSVLDDMDLQ